MASEDGIDEFRPDRTQFSVVRLTDPDDSVGYWLSRPLYAQSAPDDGMAILTPFGVACHGLRVLLAPW
jgi:hypothetical protein